MGLIGDLNELKQDWEKYPAWIKLILIVSFFITVSSITSLSDVIFQWKGFIKEGMVFYRLHIVSNLQSLLSSIGIKFSERFIDFYTIYSLIIIAPLIKTTFYSSWPSTTNQRKLKIYKKYHRVMIFNLIGMIVVPLIMYILDQFLWDWNVIIMVVIYGITVFSFTKLKKSLLSSIAPSILALVLVLIMAAINSGLTR